MRSERFALLVGLALLAGGCDVVLGLDKLKKCPDECDASSEAGEVDADAGPPDAPPDAFLVPDGASEAASWANFRMENPSAEVEAGAPGASLASFDASVPGELDDDVTHLRWSTSAGQASSIESAAAFCASLSPSGWRVPTRIEIVTLLDTTRKSPYVEPPFVPVLADAGVGSTGFVWSSSYVRPIQATGLEFWFASLADGDMKRVAAATAGTAGVLCVR